ncbi:MAG: hypothetical protein RIS26_304 [Actinomycetota bacterium]
MGFFTLKTYFEWQDRTDIGQKQVHGNDENHKKCHNSCQQEFIVGNLIWNFNSEFFIAALGVS